MAEHLYSIVIPTRERPDVLHFAIRTVLKLNRPNYELIVMDNCGSPETRQVVEAFGSPRIRYFRASERLSMTDNWERGLGEAGGDYVTFLGDDDGILPDALEIAERFHGLWPDRILSWWPFAWMWPDFLVPNYRNLAHMHFGGHVERINSRRFLKNLLAGRRDWTSLPTLYCSFVPRQAINAFRQAHGRFFLGALPDVASGIANLWTSDEFYCAYRPLTCWGLSRHSTGASQFFDAGTTAEQFDVERRGTVDEAWHPLTSGADLIVEVRVADLYFKMKEKLFPHDDELKVDMAALLDSVATRAAPRFHRRWDMVRAAVEEMATKNGLDPRDYPVSPPVAADVDRFAYTLLRDADAVVRFSHFTDPNFIRTIEDFIELAERMCLPASRVRISEGRGLRGFGRGKLGRLRRIASRLHRMAVATPAWRFFGRAGR